MKVLGQLLHTERTGCMTCQEVTLCAGWAQGDAIQAEILRQVREKQQAAKRKRDMRASCRCEPPLFRQCSAHSAEPLCRQHTG